MVHNLQENEALLTIKIYTIMKKITFLLVFVALFSGKALAGFGFFAPNSFTTSISSDGKTMTVDYQITYWSDLGSGNTPTNVQIDYNFGGTHTYIDLGPFSTGGNNFQNMGNFTVDLTQFPANVQQTIYVDVHVSGDSEGPHNEYLGSSNFTYSPIVTGVNVVKTSTVNNEISAIFNGSAKVELYNSAGQLIAKKEADNQYKQTVSPGLYILRINGESHKLIVR